jgi:hypothetical protein
MSLNVRRREVGKGGVGGEASMGSQGGRLFPTHEGPAEAGPVVSVPSYSAARAALTRLIVFVLTGVPCRSARGCHDLGPQALVRSRRGHGWRRCDNGREMRLDDQRTNPDERRCRICGMEVDLTFEHLPPKSAFNARRAELFGMEDWLNRSLDTGRPEGRGKIQQRGSGATTLCAICNNNTGAWYVPDFAKWCRTGAGIIARGTSSEELNADPSETWMNVKLFEVRPARFLKQIVTMLLSIAPAGFVFNDNLDLAEYVQDPERVGLPERYQLYLALYRGPYARFAGVTGRLNVETGQSEVFLELAYPPFAYVLSLTGEAPGCASMSNITGFADLRIDQRCTAELDLLNGFGHTALPGDYRTMAAVEADRAANRAA